MAKTFSDIEKSTLLLLYDSKDSHRANIIINLMIYAFYPYGNAIEESFEYGRWVGAVKEIMMMTFCASKHNSDIFHLLE